jgi:1-phosphatidylinositol-3-phosphate 5-kinase
MDLLIMENLFYGRQVDRIYDLKGSSRDRYAVDSGSAGLPVLLDDNLRELNQAQPTLVAPDAYNRLQRAVWADTGKLVHAVVDSST